MGCFSQSYQRFNVICWCSSYLDFKVNFTNWWVLGSIPASDWITRTRVGQLFQSSFTPWMDELTSNLPVLACAKWHFKPHQSIHYEFISEISAHTLTSTSSLQQWETRLLNHYQNAPVMEASRNVQIYQTYENQTSSPKMTSSFITSLDLICPPQNTSWTLILHSCPRGEWTILVGNLCQNVMYLLCAIAADMFDFLTLSS